MLGWIKAFLVLIGKQVFIHELEAHADGLTERRNSLLLDIAKLEAKFEERKKLFEEWSTIHQDHKDTISGLLDAIKGKGK